MNVPAKPIDSRSTGIRHRLLVESTFESIPQILSPEMEVGSTIAELCSIDHLIQKFDMGSAQASLNLTSALLPECTCSSLASGDPDSSLAREGL
ncbi:unnamed protein product [Protopolystoma xenopodis]|uniref:Uncharacterized protein n=1 Tax=Protopolystoma xenopodis TaxID=117903 RepID=A0A448WW77_9PLAT|nr:unnamed protein product [Protopolystoma xenopodis]